jgi:hypothetical protein
MGLGLVDRTLGPAGCCWEALAERPPLPDYKAKKKTPLGSFLSAPRVLGVTLNWAYLAKFAAPNSQLTNCQKAAKYFGRALR